MGRKGCLSVFDVQERVIGREGAGAACPYCGGPVLAWDYDSHLFFWLFPISHKIKRKFCCTICSRRLLPAH
ncbi:hypothetical protein FH972_027373 [Carpinus fangiana]|uniref:Zinc-ribbon 15 domain-containing protein n=1 Tax=Carpinus fangiana TaxID=176857 RepID=A0A5N6Q7G5_9ROSI|nr:hypothetical protein FH972_027373 [Carpinus fangiana]